MKNLIQIETKNGVIYYNKILNNFYLKDNNSFILFTNKKVLYSKMIVKQMLEIKSVHLRSETCIYTGKILIKVCLNQLGGIHILKTSYNKKDINKFVIDYKVS